MAICESCNGLGSVEYWVQGAGTTRWTCPTCGGTGEALDTVVPRCCDPTSDSGDPVVQRLEATIEALKQDRSDLSDDIERLHCGLRGIKREFCGHSINNGTCTLGQFIDMLIQNDTRAARRLAKELGVKP